MAEVLKVARCSAKVSQAQAVDLPENLSVPPRRSRSCLWFLSKERRSVFARRFYLFQVGLKINGEKLLQVQDDGGFLKSQRHERIPLTNLPIPTPATRVHAPTHGSMELLLISRKFTVITDEMIVNERKRFRNEIIHNIESFSERAVIRNLKSLGRFTKEQVGLIYDALYKAMCIVPPPPAAAPPPSLFTTNGGREEKSETMIELRTFRYFLSEIATWARDDCIEWRRVDNDVAEQTARSTSGIPLAEERCPSKTSDLGWTVMSYSTT
ncbi:hypothetical protein JOM56_007118 [Amanita muscaria]